MSFSITHRGQKLTQQQLDALVPVLNRHMHGEIKKRDLDAEFDKALEAAGCPVVVPGEPVALTVWYGAMPESNGKSNWTAILYRRGGDIADGITIARSEYPDRVRYEADRMKYLIGESANEPFILDYDADKHSGYVAPDALLVASGTDGLPLQQEPKYTTNGHALVNRASGEAIPADEPVFIFRARDVHAREALEAYACVLVPGLHRDKVCERIADFAKFAAENPQRMKVPDTAQVLLVASGEESGHD